MTNHCVKFEVGFGEVGKLGRKRSGGRGSLRLSTKSRFNLAKKKNLSLTVFFFLFHITRVIEVVFKIFFF